MGGGAACEKEEEGSAVKGRIDHIQGLSTRPFLR